MSEIPVRPSAVDPPEVEAELWQGFRGDAGWDIGANCGQSVGHMLAACRIVYAFEPAAESYGYLQQHFGWRSELVLLQLAVSDRDGAQELAAIPALMATGQLVTPGTHGMEWDPATGWTGIPRRVVPAKTADALAGEYGRPDVVKVDTEGHEGHVLRGASGLLGEGKTSWLIEFHAPELRETCLDLLACAGYAPETVRHPHYPRDSHMWHQHGWIKAFARLAGRGQV